MQEVWFLFLKYCGVQSYLDKKITGSWNSVGIPKEKQEEGLAIKVMPELLGNDTLDSQVFTLIFEAVPMYGLTWLCIKQAGLVSANTTCTD